MADNEEELVDYDEEEVRNDNNDNSTQPLPTPKMTMNIGESSMDPLASRISNYASSRKITV